jgi:hypothetical protein
LDAEPFASAAPFPPSCQIEAELPDNGHESVQQPAANAKPGVAEAEFEADIPKTLRTLLGGAPVLEPSSAAAKLQKRGDKFFTGVPIPGALPDWLTEGDIAHFV